MAAVDVQLSAVPALPPSVAAACKCVLMALLLPQQHLQLLLASRKA